MRELPKLKLHGITILRILITSFILGFVAEAHAGLHGLTAHSRSNCVNNESITWHAGYNYWMRVISFHNYAHVQKHVSDTFTVYTWRAAAVCWGEAPKIINGLWDVYAYHLLYNNAGTEYVYQITAVNDCSIYDGWWD